MLTTHPFDDDKLREECGVFGVLGPLDAAALVALGLHALQHRGQEAAGIVSFDGRDFPSHRALGQVGDIFGSEAVMRSLKGNAAIGHVRYATTGETAVRNVQPLYAEFEFGGFALAHNGNLTNALMLRRQLVRRGCLFQSTTDTETIIHLMATARGGNVIDRLVEALRQVEGAYSLVCLGKDQVIGVRDPSGVRPLVLGMLGEHPVLASETVALDIIGAEYIRDVAPGEMVVLEAGQVQSLRPFQSAPSKFCIFEYIYFARPDSFMEGHSVYEVRKKIGAQLAIESNVDADIVIPVPDSGVPAALGYAEESGISFDLGIIRNHYVGRTFIQPTDKIRRLGVKLKHNANRAYIQGKRVILVDDSIVRGTTSVKIVEMMRDAGAKEVHMRISSPPTSHSCFYGIDTPEKEKLLAHKLSVEEMRRFIGADSLAFISLDGLYKALGHAKRDAGAQYCDACFTGDYPIPLTDFEAPRPADVHQLAERRA
ncbi:amidophosphoribosyltransferase [Aerophototrophica crusticola]|uniref:Amidophosphoribosyltransferase n=1 Tax=Aerophototrophica crusticola TaxID=1709002 RepID=A0A858R5C5_9PROT|nr:amidophosphoribosyltransferase [Rhodospirillaceae bacterium B3]